MQIVPLPPGTMGEIREDQKMHLPLKDLDHRVGIGNLDHDPVSYTHLTLPTKA